MIHLQYNVANSLTFEDYLGLIIVLIQFGYGPQYSFGPSDITIPHCRNRGEHISALMVGGLCVITRATPWSQNK